MHERDRFELLSAYLDGEVTAAEKQQIEDWLRTDLEVQHLFARALQLRQQWRTIPMPPAQQSVDRTIGRVFPGFNATSKIGIAWCGTVLAALLLSTFLGIQLPKSRLSTMTDSPQPRLVLRKLLLKVD